MIRRFSPVSLTSFTFVLLAVSLVECAGQMTEIPDEAKAGWRRLRETVSEPATWKITQTDIENAKDLVISRVVKRFNGYWLIEQSNWPDNDNRVQRDVSGPEFEFRAVRNDAQRWQLPIIGDNSKSELERQSPMVSSYWDFKHYLNLPFSYLPYQSDYSEFFSNCTTLELTADGHFTKVSFSSKSAHGWFRFDTSNDWRLDSLEWNSTLSPGAYRYSIQYLDGLKRFLITQGEGEGGMKTEVVQTGNALNRDEFTLGYYGVDPISKSRSIRWWQRPALWLTVIGIAILCLAMRLRRQHDGE